MLLSDVTDLCRDLLNDSRSPFRWVDDLLIRFLNQAFLEAKQLRPDLFISTAGVVTKYTSANLSDGTEFPIDDMYLMVITEFVVGMVEMTDDEFTVDGRAVTFLTVYRRALEGTRVA